MYNKAQEGRMTSTLRWPQKKGIDQSTIEPKTVQLASPNTTMTGNAKS